MSEVAYTAEAVTAMKHELADWLDDLDTDGDSPTVNVSDGERLIEIIAAVTAEYGVARAHHRPLAITAYRRVLIDRHVEPEVEDFDSALQRVLD